MNDLLQKLEADPLINILRCFIALDVPDEVANLALRQARAEMPNRRDASIAMRAANIIRRKDSPCPTD